GTDTADLHVAANARQFQVAGADAADFNVAADLAGLDIARAQGEHVQLADVMQGDVARAHLGRDQTADPASVHVPGADIGAHGGGTGQPGIAGADHELHQHAVRHAAGEVQVG